MNLVISDFINYRLCTQESAHLAIHHEFFNQLISAIQTPFEANARDLSWLVGRLKIYVANETIPEWIRPFDCMGNALPKAQDIFLAIIHGKELLIQKLIYSYHKELTLIKDELGRSPLWYLIHFRPALIPFFLSRFPEWVSSPHHSPDLILPVPLDPERLNTALDIIGLKTEQERLVYLVRSKNALSLYLKQLPPPTTSQETWDLIETTTHQLATTDINAARRLLSQASFVWPAFSQALMVIKIDPSCSIFKDVDREWKEHTHEVPRAVLEKMGITEWVNYSPELPDCIVYFYYAVNNRIKVNFPSASFIPLDKKPSLSPETRLPPHDVFDYFPQGLCFYTPELFDQETRTYLSRKSLPSNLIHYFYFLPQGTQALLAGLTDANALLVRYLSLNKQATYSPEQLATTKLLIEKNTKIPPLQLLIQVFNHAYKSQNRGLLELIFNSEFFARTLDNKTKVHLATMLRLNDARLNRVETYLHAGGALTSNTFMQLISECPNILVPELVKGWVRFGANTPDGLPKEELEKAARKIIEAIKELGEMDELPTREMLTLAYAMLKAVSPHAAPLLDNLLLPTHEIIEYKIELLDYMKEAFTLNAGYTVSETALVAAHFESSIKAASETLSCDDLKTMVDPENRLLRIFSKDSVIERVAGTPDCLKQAYHRKLLSLWVERFKSLHQDAFSPRFLGAYAQFEERKTPIIVTHPSPDHVKVYWICPIEGKIVSEKVSVQDFTTFEAFSNALFQKQSDQVNSVQRADVEFTSWGQVNYTFLSPETGNPVVSSFYGINHIQTVDGYVEKDKKDLQTFRAFSEGLGLTSPLLSDIEPELRLQQYRPLPKEALPNSLFFYTKPLVLMHAGERGAQGFIPPLGASPDDFKALLALAPYIQDLKIDKEVISRLPPAKPFEYPQEAVEVDLSPLSLENIEPDTNEHYNITHFREAILGQLDSPGWLLSRDAPSKDFLKFRTLITHIIKETHGTELFDNFLMTVTYEGGVCTTGLLNIALNFYHEYIRQRDGICPIDNSIPVILSYAVSNSCAKFEQLLLGLKEDEYLRTQSVHVTNHIKYFLFKKGLLKTLPEEVEHDNFPQIGESVYSSDHLEELFQTLFPLLLTSTFGEMIDSWTKENQCDKVSTCIGAIRTNLENSSHPLWTASEANTSSSSHAGEKRSSKEANLKNRPAKERRDAVDRIINEHNLIDEKPTLQGLLFLLESQGVLARDKVS